MEGSSVTLFSEAGFAVGKLAQARALPNWRTLFGSARTCSRFGLRSLLR
jgi:hypothetical protein